MCTLVSPPWCCMSSFSSWKVIALFINKCQLLPWCQKGSRMPSRFWMGDWVSEKEQRMLRKHEVGEEGLRVCVRKQQDGVVKIYYGPWKGHVRTCSIRKIIPGCGRLEKDQRNWLPNEKPLPRRAISLRLCSINCLEANWICRSLLNAFMNTRLPCTVLSWATFDTFPNSELGWTPLLDVSGFNEKTRLLFEHNVQKQKNQNYFPSWSLACVV